MEAKTWTQKAAEVWHNLGLLASDARKAGFGGLCKAIYDDLVVGRSAFEWLYLIALSAVPVVVWLYSGMSDTLGFITSLTGIINVIFVTEGRKSNYLFGLITTTIYLFLAFERRFYGEMLTNIYFVIMQPIGLYVWLMADRKKVDKPVENQGFQARRLDLKGWIIALAQTAAVWLLMGFAYQSINSARPFRDSITDGTNVVGQKLMTELYVEQWIFWIATNVFTIYLWWGESLDITAMYWVYTLNSIVGMVRWLKDAKASQA